jgi:hypothetical protein
MRGDRDETKTQGPQFSLTINLNFITNFAA